MGEEFTTEQRGLLTSLAFSCDPIKDLVPDHRSSTPTYYSLPFRSRLCALHFGLELFEMGPQEGVDWNWSDFSDLDFQQYRREFSGTTGFFSNTAAVVAARRRNWGEEPRWRMAALFQSYPAESESMPPPSTFSVFAAAGFMKKAEVQQRVRDFALRYPNNGNNFVTVIGLGKQFEDPSLVEFGRTEAEKFIGKNANLQGLLDQMASPSK